MFNNPLLHIQTTDRPILGLLLHSDQIPTEHFTIGQNEAKIT